ncbi:hypothetical protein [Prolixibacter sp. NT017]|uniref:hypothetical protein n=1 Tax=Prolixibacter sp. NT017 TaxID=2652390 RepID=UPI001271F599|nr:hypothetical protein [Prolixibacter sp. NT017]GET25064.1 hypothetical protein NT017_13930 [Prolixibacter sp. NT017]
MAMHQDTIDILDQFCKPLPSDLRRKIRSEFDSRLKETKWFISNTDFYAQLDSDTEVIEIILLLTVYYKRVIICLDSATRFYTRVSKIKDSDGIQIGKFNYDYTQNNKILGVIINFKRLKEMYQLPEYIFEYVETKEFIRKIVTFKESFSDV